MNVPALRGLIFDLDGTLCDTIPVCIAAFRAAFAPRLGRELSDAEISALFGPNEEGIIQRVVPDDWQACLADYLKAYERAHDACPAPFDGITALLSTLRAGGIRLAIVTGKGAGSCEISLRRLGLAPYFDSVMTGSAAGVVKADRMRAVLATWRIPAEGAAYVGDSPFDMRDAREVGVRGLAAGWAGSVDSAALRDAAPDAFFSTVVECAAWMSSRVRPS
jgi:pyrophosphatase PpaX